MDFKGWSSVLGTWVSIAGVAVGGFLALDAYNNNIEVRREEVAKQADGRTVQTFAFAEQFNSGEMLRIRSKLVESGPDIATLGRSMDQDFWAFVDFFDIVQICVDRNLCDAGLAWQLFNPYAVMFHDPMLSSIEAVRRGEEARQASYRAGYGLERLAKSEKDYLPE